VVLREIFRENFIILRAKLQTVVFVVLTLCGVIVNFDVTEERADSIFRVTDLSFFYTEVD
jgi:hypothetical protein